MPIVRFEGLNGQTYTFPTALGDQEYRDNFKKLMTRTSKTPGANGGVDEFGLMRAPSPVGMVQFGIVLESEARAGMDAIRDALAAIADWGTGRLVYQPTDPTAAERWCWAKVNDIDDPEKRHLHTDLNQPVKLSFEVPDPFWYTKGNEFLWDTGELWDAPGLTWDGTGALTSVTTSGDITVTNNGNAFTIGNVLLVKDTAGTANYFRIQRVVNGVVKDEIQWNSPLFNGQYLLFDARRHKILSATGVVSQTPFDHLRPDWLHLKPGANTIRVLLDGTVKVAIRYLERYV